MSTTPPETRHAVLQRTHRRVFAVRYGLLGVAIVVGLLVGLVLPAVRQRPFSPGRVGIACGVVVLGIWSWGTLMRERLRPKE